MNYLLISSKIRLVEKEEEKEEEEAAAVVGGMNQGPCCLPPVGNRFINIFSA